MTRSRSKSPKFHDPVEAAYREIPPRLVAAAAAAAARIEASDDPEALHDFRVAVRRLRTHLEAHRASLGKRRAEKLRDELSTLVTTTNTIRDLEVQQRWLHAESHRKSVPKLQREGLNLVLADMNGGGRDMDSADLLKPVVREFASIGQELQKRGWMSPGPGTGAVYRGERLSAATSRTMLKNTDMLRRHLAKLGSVDDVKATHRARLAVKRIRYLLEPLEELIPGARKVVQDLKHLQDRLGDLRDRQILETLITVKVGEAAGRWSDHLVATGTRDLRVAAITKGTPENRACYALAAGMQRVRREGRREFKRLEKRWLDGRADRMLDRIDNIARRL